MKKWLVISIILVLICVVGLSAGCVTDEYSEVDGTLHNNTEYRAYVYFVNEQTGKSWMWGVVSNDTRSGSLDVGTYSLTARYDPSDEYIDSAEIVVEPSDSTFTIIIYNTTLYAEAY